MTYQKEEAVNPDLDSQCIDLFLKTYQRPPVYLVKAPGRVNLIGEHTDYNEGFVLPAAINRFARIALRPLIQPKVSLYSVNLGKKVEIDLNVIPRDGIGWERYLIGVAGELAAAGKPLQGWEGVILSDVPIGGGLSSSAAVEMAYANAFAAAADQRWEPKEMALIGQRADKNWVGISSGIMDHLISAAGVEGHALLIDCKSLDFKQVPMLPDHSILIMDTKTRRQLVDSTYNKIRKECEEAAKRLGGNTLRDIQDIGAEQIAQLPLALIKRVNHVIHENVRTLDTVEALRTGDASKVGELMYASHCSLRDEYEVSCQALDMMVECAMNHASCIGARMTGAGFGGCAVALVEKEGIKMFIEMTAQCYQHKMNQTPELFDIQVSNGASYKMI